MSGKVDLYDSAYGNYESATYRQVRIETYGEDLGRTSWVTTERIQCDPPNAGAEIQFGCAGTGVRLWGICIAPWRKSGMPGHRAGHQQTGSSQCEPACADDGSHVPSTF